MSSATVPIAPATNPRSAGPNILFLFRVSGIALLLLLPLILHAARHRDVQESACWNECLHSVDQAGPVYTQVCPVFRSFNGGIRVLIEMGHALLPFSD